MKLTAETIAWWTNSATRLDPKAQEKSHFNSMAFYDNESFEGSGWVRVGSATITIDFDSLDSLAEKQIAALREEMKRVELEAAQRVDALQTSINNLLSLPNEVKSTEEENRRFGQLHFGHDPDDEGAFK